MTLSIKKERTKLSDPILLVGLKVRTNNSNEMNPAAAKIGTLVSDYFNDNAAQAMKHRVSSGLTYAAYTDYESDAHGDYTYFIGEAVSSFDRQDMSRFKTLTIPAGAYQKFTTETGKMPNIVIQAWQTIWQMTPAEFEGSRTYLTDFEIYDQRALNPERAVVDIYIGIKQPFASE